jgi:hypothetical protein
MADQTMVQLQQPSIRKTFLPAVVAVIIWLILHISYDLLGFIQSVALYRTLASINWVLLVISVGFSSIVIYPVAYFRGVPVKLRIAAVYLLPLAWCIKEFIRVSAGVTVAEALFFVLFTSIQLLILIGQVGLIGLAEILCRFRDNKQGHEKRIFTTAPILAVAFTLTFLYFALLRGGGYDFHLMVKMIYRSLFL